MVGHAVKVQVGAACLGEQVGENGFGEQVDVLGVIISVQIPI